MEVRAHVWFSGRVQGVFFRANTEKKAKELSVNGWVRNLPDGRVEAIFEGEEPQVNALIEWCRTSQPYAKVSDVEIRWEEPQGEKGFRIRY